jgi:hypothetical protein
MEFTGTESPRSQRLAAGDLHARRVVTGVLCALRTTAYAVLAVLRPFVVAGLTATALACLGLCVFFGTVAPATHFPMAGVFLTAVACAVLIVAYYALMELLLPP